jgi:hypothetical protein
VRHKDTSVAQDQKALWVLLFNHNFTDHPLFPNLPQLEFVDVKHAVHCPNTFLSTKWISLSLFWDDSGSDERFSPAFRKIFLIIEQRAVHTEELDLGTFQSGLAVNTAQEPQILSDLVCKM